MAKAKTKTKKPATIKPGSSYTRSKLVAHLAAKAEAGGSQITKKAMAVLLEELVAVILSSAPAGATIPGLGKVILRKIKARPARKGRNPRSAKAVKDSIK